MALINCTECNHEISDKATTCPGCGAPVIMQPEKEEAPTQPSQSSGTYGMMSFTESTPSKTEESKDLACKQCGGEMRRSKKAESSLALQLLGVVLFFFGIGLLFAPPVGTLLGIILMIGSLGLGYSKKKVWKCKSCGYYFERA